MAPSSLDIMTCADTGAGIVRRTTDGSTWFAQNTGDAASHFDIHSAVGSIEAWCVGAAQARRWGGISWAAAGGGAANLRHIFMLRPNFGIQCSEASPIEISHYDGIAWSFVSVPSDVELGSSVWIYDATNAWITAQRISDGRALILYWNGTAWSIQHVAPVSFSFLKDIWGTSPSEIWAGGGFLSGPDLLRRTGSTWATEAGFPATDRITGIHGLDGSNVWFSCGVVTTGDVVKYNGTIYSIVDTVLTQQLADVVAVSPTRVYAVGSGGTIRFFNGDVWSAQSSGVSDFLVAITRVGVDTDPPFLQNEDPAPGSGGHPVTTDITLEIDDDITVDPATVVLQVNGVLAWAGDAAQLGFAVTKTAAGNGFRYVINPDALLPVAAFITIGVSAQDSIGNTLDTSYVFSTALGTPITVEPNPVSCRGGDTLVLTGSFPLNTVVEVLIDGIPAYAGSGLGLAAKSLDGVTLKAAVPPLASGEHVVGVRFNNSVQSATELLRVLEHHWENKSFWTRGNHPPWAGVGNRRLEISSLSCPAAAAEEELDMLPRLTWTDATTITVDDLTGMLPSRIRFSDGVIRPFAGPSTFSPAAAVGLGGLDAGSEAADTWYYLYLAMLNGTMGVIGSTVAPAGVGPTGVDSYRYIGAIRNNASSDITKFMQTAADTFSYEDEVEVTSKMPASIAALSKTSLHDPGAAYDVGDVVPPDVASSAFIHWLLQKNATAGNTLSSDLFVDGHIDTVTTGGFGSPQRFVRYSRDSSANFSQEAQNLWIPLPFTINHPQIGLRVYRDGGTVLPNNFYARFMGWKDVYLG